MVKNVIYKLKVKIDKLIDIATLKQTNKILQNEINELRKNQTPLIDMKNRYLSDLRIKNLKIARLEKEIESLKKKIQNWKINKIML